MTTWTEVDEDALESARQNSLAAQQRVADLTFQKEAADAARFEPLLAFCSTEILNSNARDKTQAGITRRMASRAKALRALLAPFDN